MESLPRLAAHLGLSHQGRLLAMQAPGLRPGPLDWNLRGPGRLTPNKHPTDPDADESASLLSNKYWTCNFSHTTSHDG